MALSPMMRQYLEIKKKKQGLFAVFPLGRFLRDVFRGRENRFPGAGNCAYRQRLRFRGAGAHVRRPLSRRGGIYCAAHRKGIQSCDLRAAGEPFRCKGHCAAGIVRIVTPGTISESSMLKEDENSFLLSVYERKGRIGAAYADISTGAFWAEELAGMEELGNLLLRVLPKEVLFDESNAVLFHYLKGQDSLYLTRYDAWPYESRNANRLLQQHFGVMSATVFGFAEDSPCLNAAGALLQYLLDTQKNSLAHIKKLAKTSGTDYMAIDQFTHRNLELTETMRSKEKRGSLLWLLDKTKTAMGSRLLKLYIEQPLFEQERKLTRGWTQWPSSKRGSHCAARCGKNWIRFTTLSGCWRAYPMARWMPGISSRSKARLRRCPASRLCSKTAKTERSFCAQQLDTLEALYSYLDECICEDPPHGIRDGGFIRPGYNAEVDKLRMQKPAGRSGFLPWSSGSGTPRASRT